MQRSITQFFYSLRWVAASSLNHRTAWFKLGDGRDCHKPVKHLLSIRWICAIYSTSADYVTYSAEDGAFAFSGAAGSWCVSEDSVAHP